MEEHIARFMWALKLWCRKQVLQQGGVTVSEGELLYYYYALLSSPQPI